MRYGSYWSLRTSHLNVKAFRKSNLIEIIQYNDSVVGPGDKFDNAYFEISYFRAYTTGVPSATPTPTPSGGSNGGGPVVTITSTATANPTSKAKSSSAAPQADMLRWALTPFLVLGTAVGMGLVLL